MSTTEVLSTGQNTAPLFNGLAKAIEVTSGVNVRNFDFIEGATLMSTAKATLIAMAIYYTVIFGGREVMRNRPAFKLNFLFKAHNLGLTIASGTLLALFLEQIVPTLFNKGVYCAICDISGGWTQPLVLLYYLNYLTKYVEFIDTCFLVLRKKPLTFLHTYHHGATALLCYLQLAGTTPVSWVPIVLNLGVHCLMYYYYFQAARGIKIWWKQYITVLQICQFFIDLAFVYFTAYNVFVHARAPQIPHYGYCAGGELAAGSGVAILTSYLFLFIAFYFATYKKGGKRPARIAEDKQIIDHSTAHVLSTGRDAATQGIQTLKRVEHNIVEKAKGAMPAIVKN